MLLRLGRLDPSTSTCCGPAPSSGARSTTGCSSRSPSGGGRRCWPRSSRRSRSSSWTRRRDASDRYTWRHALTQEAIAGDTVLPKRLSASTPGRPTLSRSREAARWRSLAISSPPDARRRRSTPASARPRRPSGPRVRRGERAARAGPAARPRSARPCSAALQDGPTSAGSTASLRPASSSCRMRFGALDELGLAAEAAEARVHLGRCYWELERPDEAMQAVERARERWNGRARRPSSRSPTSASRASMPSGSTTSFAARPPSAAPRSPRQASADFERVWALSFVALGWFGTAARVRALRPDAIEEAIEKGYSIIAGNTIHNEIWDRVHTLAGGTREASRDMTACPSSRGRSVLESPRAGPSWQAASRETRSSRPTARSSDTRAWETPSSTWRSHLAAAEALLELGRSSEAAGSCHRLRRGAISRTSCTTPRRESGSRSRSGAASEAAELGRRASSNDELLRIRGTVALRGRGIAGRRIAGRGGSRAPAEPNARRSTSGSAGLDLAEGRILLAPGKPAEARPLLERALAVLRGVRAPALGLARSSARGRGGRPVRRRRRGAFAARVVHPRRPPRGRGSGSETRARRQPSASVSKCRRSRTSRTPRSPRQVS